VITLEQCEHPRQEHRRRVHSDKTVHVVIQCLDCGSPLGSVPKTKWLGRLNPNRLPEWDGDLWRKYSERRTAEIAKAYEDKREKESREWWDKYNAYLLSPAWRALRAKVLQRDKLVCQGCGRPGAATQVHHLTYDRVFREMMFDLVSVCDACHKAIHADRKEGVK
jgi:5-methylcytosine-specific restriction endonuclease McrA